MLNPKNNLTAFTWHADFIEFVSITYIKDHLTNKIQSFYIVGTNLNTPYQFRKKAFEKRESPNY